MVKTEIRISTWYGVRRMIKIKTVTIRNFFSYGNQNTVVDLTAKGTTMIVGENLDDTSQGKSANGVGKTVIVNALTYALYEQPVSKIEKIDGLINTKNKQNMYVTVVFDNNGVEYTVTRARATKGDKRGKNFVEILENGVDITPAGGSKYANQYIENILKMPYELFVRIVVFSATNEPFLRLDSKKAREVIESLFGLTELTTKELVLKEHIKETNSRIKNVQDGVEAKQQAYDRWQQQLVAADNRVKEWDNSHSLKLNKLIQEIEGLSTINFPVVISALETKDLLNIEINNVKKEIQRKEQSKTLLIDTITKWDTQFNSSLAEVTATLNKLNSIDVEAQTNAHTRRKEYMDGQTTIVQEQRLHDTQLKSLNSELVTIRKNVTKYSEEIKHLEDNNCPYCKQLFPDAPGKIDIAKSNLDTAEVELTRLTKQIDICNEVLGTLDKKYNNYRTQIEECNKEIQLSLTELNDIHQQKTKAENQLLALNDSINPYGKIEDVKDDPELENDKNVLAQLQQQLDIINKTASTTDNIAVLKAKEKDLAVKTHQLQTLSEESNPHTQPLQDLVDSPIKEPDISELNDLVDDLEHQKFLQKLLINKDSFVRKSLLSKSLPFLNSRLTGYLTQLGLPYKVEFTPQLTACITRMGEEMDFGNLSNGQAARVNIALSFAFRDVLQQLHTPINVCILDEVLDIGLDGVGVLAASKLLKQKAREDNISMFIISHKEEVENAFEKKITVQMQQGFSYIV